MNKPKKARDGPVDRADGGGYRDGRQGRDARRSVPAWFREFQALRQGSVARYGWSHVQAVNDDDAKQRIKVTTEELLRELYLVEGPGPELKRPDPRRALT